MQILPFRYQSRCVLGLLLPLILSYASFSLDELNSTTNRPMRYSRATTIHNPFIPFVAHSQAIPPNQNISHRRDQALPKFSVENRISPPLWPAPNFFPKATFYECNLNKRKVTMPMWTIVDAGGSGVTLSFRLVRVVFVWRCTNRIFCQFTVGSPCFHRTA